MNAADGQKIAMRGAGYYSANTVGAKYVIDRVGDLVVGAVAKMPRLADGQPFAIADFGAADGGTSMDMMRRLIGAIRATEPDRAISITYTDLPHNDFSTLFRLSQGLLGPSTEAPLAETPALYIFGSGTSFYRQIVPDNSLSFGFSATAMHWISKRPCMIADHVQAVGAAEAERERFRAQSLLDWETILLSRAHELRSGGRLALANFCVDEEGRYLGHTTGVDMFDSFARHWRDLLRAGRIGESEYVNATFQQFYKTPDEFAAPFRDPASSVSRAGLKLETMFTMVTPCPYAEAFRTHGNARDFAQAYVPTLRSWSETVFANSLDPSRPAADRAAIVDDLYGAYEADVAQAPEGHRMDYVHCVTEIVKS
ncbi:SAM-dependent methyltransferase [Mesorhizobium sp. CU2]|uniref:SAM-dependent methyltransferase n=1 Tax=unclassified Mesorhizobium TaxID=325217 RepID=UPI00112CD815|nr:MULTISPECIES: SAM-dependent methyltransferase [unclassified Mesorhizobium]TPN85538.1 SAM-dependent methyltransferase [Mesorhizobium sp. CU3]TPO11357.1 SAM-dependent methyltransferase [Mesorhizobium sp. CU2]